MEMLSFKKMQNLEKIWPPWQVRSCQASLAHSACVSAEGGCRSSQRRFVQTKLPFIFACIKFLTAKNYNWTWTNLTFAEIR